MIFSFGIIKLSGQTKLKAIPDVPFNKVMMCEFYPSPEEPDFRKITQFLIQPSDFLSDLKRTYINSQESAKLYKLLTDPHSFDGGSSICWEPRLGIVFLKNDIAVNYISVCMECNKLRSMLYISGNEIEKSEDTNGVNFEKGLSPAFRKFINALLRKYNFKYTTESDSGSWDK